MNPLFSASYPYILIHSIPNDIYLGTACVLGLFIASVSLRFAYNFADNPRLWNKVETARAMYGLYIARAVSFLSLIAALFLMGRLQYPMERDWWHAQSFNKGNWNIYRLVAAVVLPLTTALFHTHCFFRFYSSFCFAGLALLDMLSQLDLAGLVHCVDVGACYNVRLLTWSCPPLSLHSQRFQSTSLYSLSFTFPPPPLHSFFVHICSFGRLEGEQEPTIGCGVI